MEDKLANLENQLKSLQEKQSIPMEEYQKEGDLQAVVERRLQNSIQACIDIGMHIITEEGSRKPESYADIFTILEEMEVLDTELSNKLKEKAGFRNVLAHEYAQIMNDKVYKHLQDLETFERFAESISNRFL
ncbi:hypothetical protein AKJ65_03390 [candidate division MSBL1 archaeon SCGC-AAA259E19]|uniref:DUF86 domain-containing protein n=2 Tax=candidate division MSBL1 TaxID=215777 RepID=A0A133V4T8_9EURY|nr:hypothetical protein AKJ65_03390 [candidate division MSBL1 archaeon SCGC-AAA259E19]KXB01454.1 hypothetical protein AKJ41_01450 [candidate division MSBL1 archaeon SCGC-AAA259O05]